MSLPIDVAKKQQLEARINEVASLWPDRRNYQAWVKARVEQEYEQEAAYATLKRVTTKPLPEQSILDIGAGMGGFAVGLRLKGINVRGIEFNPTYVEIANLRAEVHGIEPLVIQGAIEQLPFADQSFDIVHCHDVLEHCQDPLKGLSEIQRILKPGGFALVTFIHRFAWNDPHFHVYGINWLPRRWGSPLALSLTSKKTSASPDKQTLAEMHYLTPCKAAREVKKRGFKIMNVRRQKLEHAVASRIPSIIGRLLGKAAGLVYAGKEYVFGPSFYWKLTKSEPKV